MALRASRLQILRGLIADQIVIRILLFLVAIAAVTLMRLVSDGSMTDFLMNEGNDCSGLNASSGRNFYPGRFLKPLTIYPFPLAGATPSSSCSESSNITSKIIRELMNRKFLNIEARALCVGEDSSVAVTILQQLGFNDVYGVDSSLFRYTGGKMFAHKLSFQDNFFNFVFSRPTNRAAMPALLMHEMERVLKPGGIGVVLVRSILSSHNSSMINEVSRVSSALKSCDIVDIYRVSAFTLIAFRKQTTGKYCFNELLHPPEECRSITKNKAYMEHLEPLVKAKAVGNEHRFSYLPNLMDISPHKKLIYIDIGAGGFVNSSIAHWFLPLYPSQTRDFKIYAVDGDLSHQASYAKMAGITFAHYPALYMENATESRAELESQAYDVIAWLKETAAGGDFVVMKINVRRTGKKLIHELLGSGILCLIDELFLHCPSVANIRGTLCGDCFHLVKALRSSGVFVHHWLSNAT